MRKKRAFTLMEIMIVILLIGIISSVVGFNMKGSLNKGKKFKTEQAMIRIKDILELGMAQGVITAKEINDDPAKALEKTNMIRNPDKLLKGGWGEKIDVSVVDDEVIVTSEKINDIQASQEES